MAVNLRLAGLSEVNEREVRQPDGQGGWWGGHLELCRGVDGGAARPGPSGNLAEALTWKALHMVKPGSSCRSCPGRGNSDFHEGTENVSLPTPGHGV